MKALPMRIAVGQTNELTDEYLWMPNGVCHTDRAVPIWGNAVSNSSDMEQAKYAPLSHGQVFTAEEMGEVVLKGR